MEVNHRILYVNNKIQIFQLTLKISNIYIGTSMYSEYVTILL